jgi:thioredoxin-related protein
VLSGGELERRYSRDFVVFEASSPYVYPEGHELRKLTSFPYTPVFVFLDSSGRKVVETQGFRSEREARALHEFVTKKAYLRTSLREFLATYPSR